MSKVIDKQYMERPMYERFSDRARKVMQLANQEAQRFNHEYVGTEHILIGLAKEGTGVAGQVLKNLDIDLRKIRLEVEKLVQPGPDMITMGKLPQTPRAKKTIEHAIEQAKSLNHNYVGTEHLLLGLLCEVEGVAAKVLVELGLKLKNVREEVIGILGHKNEMPVDISDILTEFMSQQKQIGQLNEASVRTFLQTAAQRGWIQGRDEVKQQNAAFTFSSWGTNVITLALTDTQAEIDSIKSRLTELEKRNVQSP